MILVASFDRICYRNKFSIFVCIVLLRVGKYVVASRRDTIDARKSAKSVSSMCRIDVRPAAEKDGVDSAADDECSSSDEVVKDPKQSFQIHSIVGRSSAPSIEPNGASVKPSQIV